MINWRADRRVAVVRADPRYCSTAPYHPSIEYPEWPNGPTGQERNAAYHGVRELLRTLGCDGARYGTKEWNPLRELIEPGQTVILKPNLVSHRNHGEHHYGITDTDCLVTHGSVIRAVLDYAAKALGSSGSIIVGDCPVQGTSWEQIMSVVGLRRLAEYATLRFPGLRIEVRDYRLATATVSRNGRVLERVANHEARGDYLGLDMGVSSLLLPLMQGEYAFGVSQYPRHRMRAAHTPTINEYLIPKDFLQADVMINLPKMKSHMKAGITCALKNLVGINGHKDYLPHFRFHGPRHGGDEYPDGNLLWRLMWASAHRDWELDRGRRKRLWNNVARACSGLLRLSGVTPAELAQGGGSWYGNDTLWRTVLDIHRAFLYHERETQQLTPVPNPRIRYFAVLDGLIGGDRESPLSPSPVPAGILAAARNPVALDTVAAALMRLDYRKLKQLAEAYCLRDYPLVEFTPDDIEVLGLPGQTTVNHIYESGDTLAFTPSRGFIGQIEYRRENCVSTPGNSDPLKPRAPNTVGAL